MKNNKLLEDRIGKLFISYSIPSVLSMVTYSLYILVDTIFVAIGAGEEALAAFNISVPIFMVYSAIGLLFGVGGATTLSIFAGSGDTSKNNSIFSMASYCCLLVGICISLFGNLNIEFVAKLLGADESILELTKIYLIPINGLAFANIFSSCIQMFIRNDFNPKIIMIATIISNIINIIGDYVLIFIFDMGILGASIPTAISPVIAVGIMLLHFLKKNKKISFTLELKDFYLLLRSIRNGLGSFFMELTSGLFVYILNFVIIRKSGYIGVSIYAIIANISYVFKYIFVGIAQSIQPIISVNFGANKSLRVKKVFKMSIITSVISSLIFYIFIFLFSKEIVSLFLNQNTDIVNLAVISLRIFFISLPFTAINIILIYYYQSTERPKIASFISILRNIILLIIGLFLFVYIFNLNGVWMSVIFAEIFTIVIILFVNKYTKL